MTFTFIALGFVLLALGFVGCVVPVLPGPVLAYAALWTLVPISRAPSSTALAVGAIAVVLVTVVDYALPAVCAKKFHCSGWGVFGCAAGTVVGLFFMPLGLVLGPFLGTVAGELVAGRRIVAAIKGGVGALLGFFACLALKLAAVAVFAALFARAAF